MLSILALALTVLCLILFVVGLFVLLKNKNDSSNQLFFWFVLAVIGWLITNYLSNDTNLHITTLLIINKAVFVFPALCALLALFFSMVFTHSFRRFSVLLRVLLLLFGLFVIILSMTGLIVRGIRPGADSTYDIIFGPLSVVYFAYLVVYFGLFVAIFVRALRRTARLERARYKYVVLGILITFLVALVTNLAIPLMFHNYAFVMYGPFSTLLLVGSISYAIVRHRLFDLRFIVARSVTYVLLLITLGILSGTVFFAVSNWVLGQNNFRSGQVTVSVVLSLLMALIFQPLRRFFERLTDRIFYRDRYDSQEVLNEFSKVLVSELDLDRILKQSLESICGQMHIQFGQLVIFNNQRVYRIEHHGPLPKRLMIVPELRKLNRNLLVADELGEGERKGIMDEHGIRVSLVLRTREEFVGFLLLGDKLSGDIYSGQDVELLEIMTKELSVAILNAKAYAEIEEFNRTLQARVDHATSRLRVANRHLKELDKAKDEFISMASHQLRTPLTTIKGYLSMMQEGDAGKLTKTQTEFVGFAFGASERMVNLISDLLNVSRLSAGRFLIQTKPTDMVAMIADEVRQLQSHADAKGLKLTFKPPVKPLPLVGIDENKTRQVVMNFIDNAIYYTQTGSVTVVLEQSDNKVRLEVRDTGIGVPREAQKKLFTKFYRADNAQIVRPDGTGLGLYLAKRVVQDQDGTIIFSSVEGQGSVFGFELPLKPIANVSKKEPAHV